MTNVVAAAAVDVDECASSSPPCTNNEICLNSYGSYVCLRRSAAVAAGTCNSTVLLDAVAGPITTRLCNFNGHQKKQAIRT